MQSFWISEKNDFYTAQGKVFTKDEVEYPKKLQDLRTKTFLLLDLFRLNVSVPKVGWWEWMVSDSEGENLLKRMFFGKRFTKIEEEAHSLDEKRIDATLRFSKQYSIVSFAIEKLSETYDQWDGIHQNETFKRLGILHENFFALIDTITELESDPNLRNLTPIPPKYKPDEDAMQSLEGEKVTVYEQSTDLIDISNALYETLCPYFINEELKACEEGEMSEILQPFLDRLPRTEHLNCYVRKTQKKSVSIQRAIVIHEAIRKNPNLLFEEIFEQVKGQKPFSQDPLSPDLRRRDNGEKPVLPIRKASIQSVAFLHKVLSEAKACAARKKKLEPVIPKMSEFDSSIFRLTNQNKEVLAYLKEGRGKSAKRLEKLAWDAACIFEIEEHFLPTTTTTIHYHQTGIGEAFHLEWRYSPLVRENFPPQMERDARNLSLILHPLDNIDRGISGSVQPAQSEIELAKWFERPTEREGRTISKDQIITASLITILYGMFDAHGGNIFVRKDGSLVFFDNTRIFPNGDVIQSEDFILTGYRSGLLQFSESFKILTPKEIGHIINKIVQFEKKIDTFKNYLNKKIFKIGKKRYTNLEGALPENWFDTELVIKGIQKRLERTRTLCQCYTSPLTLRDLIFAANPDFKLISTMHLAVFTNLEQRTLSEQSLGVIQRDAFPAVGSKSVQFLINKCQERGIDLVALKQACDTPEIPYDTLIRNLIEKRTYFSETPHKSAEEILRYFTKIVVPDFKDVNIESLTYSSFRLAVMSNAIELQLDTKDFNLIKKEPVEITIEGDEDISEILKPYQQQLKEEAECILCGSEKRYVIASPVILKYEPKFTLFYKEKDGKVHSVKMDFISTPGKLTLEDYAMPIQTLKEFKNFCDDLPISLRYRERSERPTPIQVWNVELDQERMTSVVILDD